MNKRNNDEYTIFNSILKPVFASFIARSQIIFKPLLSLSPSVVSSPRRTTFTNLANTPRTQPQTPFNKFVILKNSLAINFHWIYQKRLKTIAAFFSPIGLPKIIFNILQTLNHSTTCTISQLGELNGKRERATSAILLSGARPLYKRCANEVCNRR